MIPYHDNAFHLLTQLEAVVVLPSFEGSKARRVMIPNEAALEAHLRQGVEAGMGY